MQDRSSCQQLGHSDLEEIKYKMTHSGSLSKRQVRNILENICNPAILTANYDLSHCNFNYFLNPHFLSTFMAVSLSVKVLLYCVHPLFIFMRSGPFNHGDWTVWLAECPTVFRVILINKRHHSHYNKYNYVGPKMGTPIIWQCRMDLHNISNIICHPTMIR